MNPIKDKHIILGVTGSIACYKAADLASKLTQAGALVDVILTESAVRFVQPITFQSVTGRKAYVDKDLWNDQGHVTHIGLGHAADLVVIAPATANTLAKLAHGIADNLLSVTSLAATCPLMIAPAMDGGMFTHPATQDNLEILETARRDHRRAGRGAFCLRDGRSGTDERAADHPGRDPPGAGSRRAPWRARKSWSPPGGRRNPSTRCAT